MLIRSHRPITWMAVCLATVWASACTSLDEFKTWSPERRADDVCKNRSDLRGMREQQRSLELGIAKTHEALTRGYHLHTQCRNVVVHGPLVEKCVSSRKDKDAEPKRTCTLVPSERIVNECSDTPVPLSAEVEKEKIQQWTANLAQSRAQEAGIYAACVQQVMGMSAEEAYKLR